MKKSMRCHFAAMTICSAGLAWRAPPAAQAEETLALENGRPGLNFDRKTGALVAIHNRLAGRT